MKDASKEEYERVIQQPGLTSRKIDGHTSQQIIWFRGEKVVASRTSVYARAKGFFQSSIYKVDETASDS